MVDVVVKPERFVIVKDGCEAQLTINWDKLFLNKNCPRQKDRRGHFEVQN